MQGGWERVVVRYPLIALVAQGRLRQREAAEELGLSERQVRRLVRRYRESGGQLGSLAYQRHHPAPNALPHQVRQAVLRLHQEYPHWSCPAIAETLAAADGVELHRTTVYRLLRQQGGHLLVRHPRPARRFERHAFGELWQMDTTSGAWLQGYRLVYVVAILDD